MAVYTKLNIENVREIMSRYGIQNITDHNELSGGSQNSNYVVRSQNGDFVLSICEQNSAEEIKNLALLLEHLAHNDFSTSILLRTEENKTMTEWNQKPVMVKRYISGVVLENIPEYIVKLIGIELGKLHKVAAPDYLPHSMSYGKEYFHEVKKYAAGSEYHEWLLDKQSYIESYITNSLPKTLIHSDVFASNVIIDKSERFVTIMDFEEATYYYRIFDVGMTIIGICREGKGINFQKVKSLLNGYTQEIQLNDEELRCLQPFVVYAATAMSFWRHKNFNYVVPTPDLFDHYKELQSIADSVFNIGNQEFLDLLK